MSQMSSYNRRSTGRISKYPIHSILVPFAVAYFCGALLTDLTYWQTAEMMWADFSAWLVSVGVVIGYLAVIAGLFDLLTKRFASVPAPVWPWVIANLVALILATLNMFIHSRDAWTSVVPWGLILSAVVVLILLFAGWMRWSAFHRRDMGVAG
jgi:uncharacterized membrane protein